MSGKQYLLTIVIGHYFILTCRYLTYVNRS